jgi:hypothetical protein
MDSISQNNKLEIMYEVLKQLPMSVAKLCAGACVTQGNRGNMGVCVHTGAARTRKMQEVGEIDESSSYTDATGISRFAA